MIKVQQRVFTGSRILVLMDGTVSMGNCFRHAKNAVSTIFDRALQILKKNNISKGFEMQFAVYRNYNCKEDKILETSAWESKPENLRSFMDTIQTSGGWGNEAVEIGLWYVNYLDASQVILIGDAPPNTPKQVTEKRKRLGEDYWLKTLYGAHTTTNVELAKFRIPVHAFYVHKNAEVEFKKIADATGGYCANLDVNDEISVHRITNLVTESILKNIGGDEKGDTLIKAYRDSFVHM